MKERCIFVCISMVSKTKVGSVLESHSPYEEQKEEPAVFGNGILTHEFSKTHDHGLVIHLTWTTPEACKLQSYITLKTKQISRCSENDTSTSALLCV